MVQSGLWQVFPKRHAQTVRGEHQEKAIFFQSLELVEKPGVDR